MKFLIITHVPHKLKGGTISAYAPYVREMNIWLKHVDDVILVAPQVSESITEIDLSYKHDNLNFKPISSINFTSLRDTFFSIIRIPLIVLVIFKACRKADHIHLRCPGNIGLLGCIVQVFFSKKSKTAKYAGNWNPDAVQPLSYKFQKWMLSNTFLTKNMRALVYGDWEKQSKNIKPFFTATYNSDERQALKVRDYSGNLRFVFIGSLVEGKRPLLAIKIVEELNKCGYDVTLDMFGDGLLKKDIQIYTKENNLLDVVELFGNKEKQIVKKALKEAHFLILPSKSEGWPKAIAEAMFFGVIPISTLISCVPLMLDYGNRGILIAPELEKAVAVIKECISNVELLKTMSGEALQWSQQYTLDVFEDEIIKLLKV